MTKTITKVALGLLVISMLSMNLFAADSAADLFKTKCAMCHGDAGAGKGSTPALSAAAGKPAAELKATIDKGKPPKMPAYNGKLTDAQIDDLVKYIQSLKK